MDAARTAGLTSRLRDAGLRATGPRIEILAALEILGGHRAAEEIHDLLTAQGERIPRSSVYNVLVSLADAGLVMRADAGPGAVRSTKRAAGGTTTSSAGSATGFSTSNASSASVRA
ncbi:MAG TPA: transcriptional repressor [Pseudonocardiaceae bacterium]